MPLTAVKPSQIRKIAANSLVGNATGAEARGTSLSVSQVRTLLGISTVSDVTFDIVRATTSVQTPLVNNASAALTLGNATYGVTVPGAATFSGDISMSKTSAQGYIYSYAPAGGYYIRMYQDDSGPNGYLNNSTGSIYLTSGNGVAGMLKSGSQNYWRIYDSAVAKYLQSTHDGTDGILSTSSGKLKLSPATTLQVTTAATFDSYIDATSYRCDGSEIINTSGALLELGVGGQSNSVRLGLNSGASGLKVFLGNTGTSASMLQVAQNGTTVMFRVADDSADAPITCAAITASGQLTNATGVITASTPAIFTQTWNSGAVTFTGLSANFTDTSSASGSMLLSIQKSSSDRVTTTKHGLTTLTFDTTQIYSGLYVKGTNGTTYWALGTTFESGDQFLQLRTADAFAGANHGGINLGAGYVHILGGPTNRTIKTYNGLKIEIASLGGSGSLEVTGGSLTTYAGRVDYSVTKTANYTLTAADYCVIATANSFDFTLPTAVGVTGTRYELMNSGAGVITLKTTSAQTISGAASAALTLDQYDSMIVRSDGANWLIVSQYP